MKQLLFVILGEVALFYAPQLAAAPGCQYQPRPPGLATREGYVEFMEKTKLDALKKRLPQVDHEGIQQVLNNPDTMWYDEDSIVYTYQDSVETVVGGRANCVGRLVGEQNRNNPDISRLLNIFGPDYRFRFPFRTAAGTDDIDGAYPLNFWSLPRQDGKVLPVKWWQASSRGRWYWIFPVGTIFGEVLFQKGPDNNLYAFEVRVRIRYLDGWSVNVFRPFVKASDLAQAIQTHRKEWDKDDHLKQVIAQINNPETLVPHKLESKPFAKAFTPIEGSLDPIPEIKDDALVKDLLTKTKFVSALGQIWKENGRLESYAPGSAGGFSIVPKGYFGGVIAVNEVSCSNCHVQTAHPIADFESPAMLYGEVWGEDRIFTWHLFEPNQRIFNTWDDADRSRVINPRLVQAKLVSYGKPGPNDKLYKKLPVPFAPVETVGRLTQ